MIADALDRDAVMKAVQQAKPHAIIHQLTAVSQKMDMRHFDREFALTNRLRSEGTDYLIAAGLEVGVRRFVAQSYAGWPYERVEGPMKNENDPPRPKPTETFPAQPRGDPASGVDRTRHPGVYNIADDEPARVGMASGTGGSDRSQTAVSHPRLAGTAANRGSRHRNRNDDARPGSLQREGKTGIRLELDLAHLARGLSARFEQPFS